MRVGVVILPQFSAVETRRRWKSLETRGFAHGWTYDHLAWRDLADEPWYSTVPTLATAAAATSHLRLGTWVTSPNFRHPVTHAKDLMSLDDIAGGELDDFGKGRIVAAIGAGGLGWDAAVLGRPVLAPKDRVDRLTEFVKLTDLLLTQPETSWRGDYFVADRARMHPSGSRDRVRLVVAGNGPRSVRFASAYDGWATTGPEGVDGADQWWDRLTYLVRIFQESVRCRDWEGVDRRTYLSMDAVPGYSFSSVAAFTAAAGRAQGLGFTDVVIHWPRPAGPYAGDEKVLDGIAELLVGGEYHC